MSGWEVLRGANRFLNGAAPGVTAGFGGAGHTWCLNVRPNLCHFIMTAGVRSCGRAYVGGEGEGFAGCSARRYRFGLRSNMARSVMVRQR